MQPLDLVVGAGIALVLALPYLKNLTGLLPKPKAAANAPWRHRWAAVLIDFCDEVEAGQGHCTSDAEALRLARELLWQIVGGDGENPPAHP